MQKVRSKGGMIDWRHRTWFAFAISHGKDASNDTKDTGWNDRTHIGGFILFPSRFGTLAYFYRRIRGGASYFSSLMYLASP
ncbi:hypothetical protein BDZ91DRAFT_734941 [Kalaharituber pfeilii]|nr:hypothetical protein BDZ91DRAFT_734941 [Kalaharituber pfeilii]